MKEKKKNISKKMSLVMVESGKKSILELFPKESNNSDEPKSSQLPEENQISCAFLFTYGVDANVCVVGC